MTEEYIGRATMLEDRTLVLTLRAESDDGSVGHARLVYRVDHPRYAAVLAHLDLSAPGETCPVRPWERP